MCQPIKIAVWFLLSLQLCQANVIFQFSLDFEVKEPENSSEPFNATILVDNNRVSLEAFESAPSTPWSEQDKFSAAAVQHLLDTKRVVQQLNVELTPLAGRSNNLAARLKRTLRYVNEVDANLENGHLAQHVQQLRKYVALVDGLQLPNRTADRRSLEYVLLKLALEKHQLLTKREQVAAYLQLADAAWTQYKTTQIVVAES